MDILASSFNRNKIEKILKEQFDNIRRNYATFSFAIMYIDNLKKQSVNRAILMVMK
jgi:PleD family two-component response regulator